MIEPEKMYWAFGNYTQIRLPGQMVLDCSASGSVDDAVEGWSKKVERYEFGEDNSWAPTPEKIRAELEEYGCWEPEELADDEQNWQRFLWVMACGIAEDPEPDCSEPV